MPSSQSEHGTNGVFEMDTAIYEMKWIFQIWDPISPPHFHDRDRRNRRNRNRNRRCVGFKAHFGYFLNLNLILISLLNQQPPHPLYLFFIFFIFLFPINHPPGPNDQFVVKGAARYPKEDLGRIDPSCVPPRSGRVLDI